MVDKQKKTVHTITLIAMCVSLITVCAWITVPFIVSFTMQTFAVFLISAITDWKKSSLSMLLYLTLGLLGIPVFAGFQSGPSVLVGPTGGYLMGFVLSAPLIGSSVALWGRKFAVLLLSMLTALLLCYGCGTAWYVIFYARTSMEISLWSALGYCVFPFLLPDLLKIGVAAFLAKRLAPILTRFDL